MSTIARILANKRRKMEAAQPVQVQLDADTQSDQDETAPQPVQVQLDAGTQSVQVQLDAEQEAWWVPHFKKAAGQYLSKPAGRKMRLDSLCSNLGSELGVLQQLGIPHEKVDCCECNQGAAEVMVSNYRSSIGCCYESIAAHSQRQGNCALHGSDCSRSRSLSSGGAQVRRDLVVVGSPCQPWSGYDGSVAKDCTAHPLFATTFGRNRHGGTRGTQPIGDSVFEFIHATKPHADLLEQIPGFGCAHKNLGGKSGLNLILEDMYSMSLDGRPLYTAHAVFELEADIFLHMSRSRTASFNTTT